MLGFQLAQLAHQRIEGGIRDFRRILSVVQVRVMLDLLAQRGNTCNDGVVSALRTLARFSIKRRSAVVESVNITVFPKYRPSDTAVNAST